MADYGITWHHYATLCKPAQSLATSTRRKLEMQMAKDCSHKHQQRWASVVLALALGK